MYGTAMRVFHKYSTKVSQFTHKQQNTASIDQPRSITHPADAPRPSAAQPIQLTAQCVAAGAHRVRVHAAPAARAALLPAAVRAVRVQQPVPGRGGLRPVLPARVAAAAAAAPHLGAARAAAAGQRAARLAGRSLHLAPSTLMTFSFSS